MMRGIVTIIFSGVGILEPRIGGADVFGERHAALCLGSKYAEPWEGRL